MVVLISLLASASALAADAGGFSVETRYTNSFGPDSWGSVHARAIAQPGLEIGALLIGGNRDVALGTARRTLRLTENFHMGAELQLGMLRTVNKHETGGPTAGFAAATTVFLDAIAIQLEGGYIGGIGVFGEGGVDVSLTESWTLSPRLRAETWSGDRDAALRIQMGVGHRWHSGLFAAVAASAGGRDVVHMGPGFSLNFGRSL